MLKTPIVYYGGKTHLLNHILPLIPKHTVYTEAFAGGLAVFFAKAKVKNEIINDTNAFAMNFYSVMSSDFEALRQKIMETPYARVVYKVALNMYEIPHLFNPLQRAWSFYVLTNMGFSGRIGSYSHYTKGSRAVSWERKKANLSPELKQRFVGVQLECTDALEIIASKDSVDTFHYVDPPYFNANMGHYGGYTEHNYKNLLEVLSKVTGKFLLSSYPSDVLYLYAKNNGWYTKEIPLKITASKSTTSNRTSKVEVLTANYPI